jgi:hypothetical protein
MSGWNFRKSLGLLGGLVRLTATKRGVSASVGRGPLRVGRGADGRYRATVRVGPFWKTVPLGRPRAREGAWPAPEGAPLPPSTRPLVAAERCAHPGCGHGPGYHDGDPPWISLYGRCHRVGCPCRGWVDPGPGAWGPPQGAPLAGPRKGA